MSARDCEQVYEVTDEFGDALFDVIRACGRCTQCASTAFPKSTYADVVKGRCCETMKREMNEIENMLRTCVRVRRILHFFQRYLQFISNHHMCGLRKLYFMVVYKLYAPAWNMRNGTLKLSPCVCTNRQRCWAELTARIKMLYDMSRRPPAYYRQLHAALSTQMCEDLATSVLDFIYPSVVVDITTLDTSCSR
jgi:hypothetical protein